MRFKGPRTGRLNWPDHINFSFAVFLVTFLLNMNFADARGSRARNTDGVGNSGDVNFQNASSGDNNPGYGRAGSANSVSTARVGRESSLLAQAGGNGAGNLSEKGPLCYKAVKQIVADAFGKELSCVRGILSDGAAKNSGKDLARAGFINKYPGKECWEPGTLRVYDGRSLKGYADTAGTFYGHIEVITDDGRFCSFYCKSQPIDKWMAAGNIRRPLKGCWVLPEGGLQGSVLNNCRSSGTPADGRVPGSGVN